jgi:hypothetical protein
LLGSNRGSELPEGVWVNREFIIESVGFDGFDDAINVDNSSKL